MWSISVQIRIIPFWIGDSQSLVSEKATGCLSCVSAVVTVVACILASRRSTTTPWSQPAWTTTPGQWFPVWTTCWPKLWRSTESRPSVNITDSWYLDDGGLETDTLTKVEDFGVRRRQRAVASSGAISITFLFPFWNTAFLIVKRVASEAQTVWR